MDISIIIVNFRSRQFLSKCFSSIHKHLEKIEYEIIIMNNDDDILDESSFSIPNVKVINMPINDGFGRACNVGSQNAAGKYLFFLNPDTELLSVNIANLLEKLAQPKTGIVAPKILLSNGSLQPWSGGNEFTLWTLIKNNLKIEKDLSLNDKVTEFDWVSGAGFLISKELFFLLKGFDEKFFMYFEDIDLCKRVRMLDHSVERINDFSILHIGGQSYNDKNLQKSHYYLSQDCYFKKHFPKYISFLVTTLRKILLLIN